MKVFPVCLLFLLCLLSCQENVEFSKPCDPIGSSNRNIYPDDTLTKAPEFGKAVVNEIFNVLWFTEPDRSVVAERDIMDFEMCIDTGTELLCRDFVLVVNYKE